MQVRYEIRTPCPLFLSFGTCSKYAIVPKCHVLSVKQILKFHERAILALKFELSGKRSQILVVNS